MATLRALLFFMAMSAHAAPTSEELKARGKPAIFTRTESFPLPAGAKEPVVVYGNNEIGRFSLAGEARAGKVAIRFVPPTYRNPLEFHLEYRTSSGEARRVFLGRKRYSYPGLKLFADLPSVSGPFSFPFVLLNAAAADTRGPRFFPAIMNSLGEVVWYSFTRATSSSRAVMLRPPEDGRYMFLRRLRDTSFTIMGFDGKVERQVSFREKRYPPSSHGFHHVAATNELLYLGFECRELPWHKEFIPLFLGLKGWWNLLWLPRRSYRAGTLIGLDLNTGNVRRIWGSYDNFEPADWPSLFVGAAYSPDRFLDARNAETYRALLEDRQGIGDWDKDCHVDWTHENSVDFDPNEGYLVSMRNQNLVLLIGLDGKLKWTLGEDPRADVKLPDGRGFGQQHSARFLPGGDVLVFDNNIPFRGYLGSRIQTRLVVIAKPEKGKPAEIRRSIDLPVPQVHIRGSTSVLRNGRFFAYAPGSAGEREVVLEVDPENLARMPRMEFGGEFAGRGIEALPIYAIGKEELRELGKGGAPAKNAPPEPKSHKTPILTPDNIIDLTY